MTEETKAQFNTDNFKAQFKKPAGAFGSNGNGHFESYDYIAKLLIHPVTDGRHRLLWLVIAPYAVSILKLDRETAIEMVRTYFAACHELKPCEDVLTKVEQYVDNAANVENGLKPPKLETIRQNDPDLYDIIVKTIT